MSEKKSFDWIDQSLFLMFSYAHLTDWNIVDSELQLIKSKITFFSNEFKNAKESYNSNSIDLKMQKAFDLWNKTKNNSDDEILEEMQSIAGKIKNHNLFNDDYTQKMLDILVELAKSDGVVVDNEIYSLEDLANFWGATLKI